MTVQSFSRRNERVLCDFWYARELPDLFEPFEAYASERLGFLAKPMLSNPVTRSAALVWMGRSFAGIAPNWYRGGRLACLLQVPFRARHVTILECIDFDINGKPWAVRGAYLWFARNILAPAMRRSVALVQVLTDWEAGVFAERYGLQADVVQTVRWPLAGWDVEASQRKGASAISVEPFVFSSGRAACDWEALFAAARLGAWPLKVVCGKKDRAVVNTLNHDGRAQIMSEISREDHDRLLAGATVYALCLKEQNKSSGQVRLAACIAAGTPVVATRVRGLEGYLIDDVTGLSAGAGDAVELAQKIEGLWVDPQARARLAKAARHAVAGYKREDYFAAIGRLVQAVVKRAEVQTK